MPSATRSSDRVTLEAWSPYSRSAAVRSDRPPLLPTRGSASARPVTRIGVRAPMIDAPLTVSGSPATSSRTLVSVATMGGASGRSVVVSRTTAGSPVSRRARPRAPASSETGDSSDSPKGRAARQADASSSRQSPGSAPSAAMLRIVSRPAASETDDELPAMNSCCRVQPSVHSDTNPSRVTEPFFGRVPSGETRSSPVVAGT